MPILLMITIAAVLYAVFDLLVAKASGQIDSYLTNGIFNGLAALLPLLVFLVLRSNHSSGHTTKQGIVMSLAAGIVLTVFSVLLVKIFARGGNLAYALPLIYGGAIVLGSFLGVTILKEHVSMLQLAGILVTTAGIGMVVAAKL